MKIDLKNNLFADELKGYNSPDAILRLLEKNKDDFKDYREKDRNFIDCLSPVVKFVHAFSDVLGEAASLVSAERSLRSTLFFIDTSFSTMFRSSPQNSSLLESMYSSSCGVLFTASANTGPNILSYQAAEGVSASYDASKYISRFF